MEYRALNEKISAERCKSLLKELETSLKTKLAHGGYSQKGGYSDFTEDLNGILKRYDECKDLGVKVSCFSLHLAYMMRFLGTIQFINMNT